MQGSLIQEKQHDRHCLFDPAWKESGQFNTKVFHSCLWTWILTHPLCQLKVAGEWKTWITTHPLCRLQAVTKLIGWLGSWRLYSCHLCDLTLLLVMHLKLICMPTTKTGKKKSCSHRLQKIILNSDHHFWCHGYCKSNLKPDLFFPKVTNKCVTSLLTEGGGGKGVGCEGERYFLVSFTFVFYLCF